MKKGFTLIELMIVIIIIGVLATVGIVQYQAAVEKSRGAEARSVIGALRSSCAAIWMEFNGTENCDAGHLGMGTTSGTIPTECRNTNFFKYTASDGAADSGEVTFVADRCIGEGKKPYGSVAGNVTLEVDFSDGSDKWSTSGNY
ncbi:MAG: prepilin-type N-terminal cleavage/methylation domain-containing protein [Candidatus Omnitrophota bacterium]